jgi:divalent metal cation (Fe/Co/Zn/Cd) transporter
VGAGFSINEGVRTIRGGRGFGSFGVSYAVLGIAFVMESISFARAMRQVRGRATRWRIPPLRYLRYTSDTAVKAVAFEDTAALVGLGIAAGGLGLTQLTGSPVWDGLASVAIGLLLLVVALVLARANVSLLVGQAVPRRFREVIREELLALPHVAGVPTLLTMQLGPDDVLIAAKVDFVDGVSGADIEATADEAERRLVARYASVRYVFLDPTRSR